MTDDQIRKIILETFEQTRQSKGAPFDESHFMDFLLQPATPKDSIKGSFKGAKKCFDFFRAIELRFGICFSDADQDKFYSVDKFTKKVKERIENVRGNKMIIQKRVAEKDRYFLESFLTLIAVLIVAYFRIHFVSLLVIAGWVIAMWWLLGGRIRDKRHNKKLYKKITDGDQSKGEAVPDVHQQA